METNKVPDGKPGIEDRIPLPYLPMPENMDTEGMRDMIINHVDRLLMQQYASLDTIDTSRAELLATIGGKLSSAIYQAYGENSMPVLDFMWYVIVCCYQIGRMEEGAKIKPPKYPEDGNCGCHPCQLYTIYKAEQEMRALMKTMGGVPGSEVPQ